MRTYPETRETDFGRDVILLILMYSIRACALREYHRAQFGNCAPNSARRKGEEREGEDWTGISVFIINYAPCQIPLSRVKHSCECKTERAKTYLQEHGALLQWDTHCVLKTCLKC